MRQIDRFRAHRKEHPEAYRVEEPPRRPLEVATVPTGIETADRKAYAREYQRRYRLTRRGRQSQMQTMIKSVRGITLEAYETAFERQRGLCAICRRGMVKGYDPTVSRGHLGPTSNGAQVDHDHGCCPGRKSCGRCFRGLLCAHCNKGLGHFRDNAELLRLAILYIEIPWQN